MAKSSQDLIRALWPLPGGNKHYLDTLDRIVKWAASVTDLTRDAFNEWLIAEYNVGKGTVSGYRQVVTGLGVLESHRDGKLSLTQFGQQILEAEGVTKAGLVIERFMNTFLAFPEVLAVYAQAGEPIHLKSMVEILQPQFPRWTSDAQFEYRALWLLSLGCLEQQQGRYYVITDLGKAVAAQFPATIETQPIVSPEPEITPSESATPSPTETLEVSHLIADLEQAATDSQNPEHLERAVAEAFEYLGFAVDQLGESGDTDVLARANIGPDSYSLIIDAKARKDGKLQDLEVYTLRDHLRSNNADYALVVAGRFAEGKIARHAEDTGVVLLGVPLLSAWLRLHHRTPLNLQEYRTMFTTPGLLRDLPASLKTSAERRALWANLIADLLELIQETYQHGLTDPLPTNQIFAMLVTRLRGVRYPKAQIEKAIVLLTHPALSAALGNGETGISLAMSRATLAHTLRALATQIEYVEAETEV